MKRVVTSRQAPTTRAISTTTQRTAVPHIGGTVRQSIKSQLGSEASPELIKTISGFIDSKGNLDIESLVTSTNVPDAVKARLLDVSIDRIAILKTDIQALHDFSDFKKSISGYIEDDSIDVTKLILDDKLSEEQAERFLNVSKDEYKNLVQAAKDSKDFKNFQEAITPYVDDEGNIQVKELLNSGKVSDRDIVKFLGIDSKDLSGYRLSQKIENIPSKYKDSQGNINISELAKSGYFSSSEFKEVTGQEITKFIPMTVSSFRPDYNRIYYSFEDTLRGSLDVGAIITTRMGESAKVISKSTPDSLGRFTVTLDYGDGVTFSYQGRDLGWGNITYSRIHGESGISVPKSSKPSSTAVYIEDFYMAPAEASGNTVGVKNVKLDSIPTVGSNITSSGGLVGRVISVSDGSSTGHYSVKVDYGNGVTFTYNITDYGSDNIIMSSIPFGGYGDTSTGYSMIGYKPPEPWSMTVKEYQDREVFDTIPEVMFLGSSNSLEANIVDTFTGIIPAGVDGISERGLGEGVVATQYEFADGRGKTFLYFTEVDGKWVETDSQGNLKERKYTEKTITEPTAELKVATDELHKLEDLHKDIQAKELSIDEIAAKYDFTVDEVSSMVKEVEDKVITDREFATQYISPQSLSILSGVDPEVIEKSRKVSSLLLEDEVLTSSDVTLSDLMLLGYSYNDASKLLTYGDISKKLMANNLLSFDANGNPIINPIAMAGSSELSASEFLAFTGLSQVDYDAYKRLSSILDDTGNLNLDIITTNDVELLVKYASASKEEAVKLMDYIDFRSKDFFTEEGFNIWRAIEENIDEKAISNASGLTPSQISNYKVVLDYVNEEHKLTSEGLIKAIEDNNINAVNSVFKLSNNDMAYGMSFIELKNAGYVEDGVPQIVKALSDPAISEGVILSVLYGDRKELADYKLLQGKYVNPDGFLNYDNLVKDIDNLVKNRPDFLEKFSIETDKIYEYKEFAEKNTELTDGKWFNTELLEQWKTEYPERYDILMKKGYGEYERLVQTASGVMSKYELYKDPFDEPITSDNYIAHNTALAMTEGKQFVGYDVVEAVNDGMEGPIKVLYGVDDGNRIIKEAKNYLANHTKLADGAYVENEVFNKFSPEAQNIALTKGSDALNNYFLYGEIDAGIDPRRIDEHFTGIRKLNDNRIRESIYRAGLWPDTLPEGVNMLNIRSTSSLKAIWDSYSDEQKAQVANVYVDGMLDSFKYDLYKDIKVASQDWAATKDYTISDVVKLINEGGFLERHASLALSQVTGDDFYMGSTREARREAWLQLSPEEKQEVADQLNRINKASYEWVLPFEAEAQDLLQSWHKEAVEHETFAGRALSGLSVGLAETAVGLVYGLGGGLLRASSAFMAGQPKVGAFQLLQLPIGMLEWGVIETPKRFQKDFASASTMLIGNLAPGGVLKVVSRVPRFIVSSHDFVKALGGYGTVLRALTNTKWGLEIIKVPLNFTRLISELESAFAKKGVIDEFLKMPADKQIEFIRNNVNPESFKAYQAISNILDNFTDVKIPQSMHKSVLDSLSAVEAVEGKTAVASVIYDWLVRNNKELQLGGSTVEYIQSGKTKVKAPGDIDVTYTGILKGDKALTRIGQLVNELNNDLAKVDNKISAVKNKALEVKLDKPRVDPKTGRQVNTNKLLEVHTQEFGGDMMYGRKPKPSVMIDNVQCMSLGEQLIRRGQSLTRPGTGDHASRWIPGDPIDQPGSFYPKHSGRLKDIERWTQDVEIIKEALSIINPEKLPEFTKLLQELDIVTPEGHPLGLGDPMEGTKSPWAAVETDFAKLVGEVISLANATGKVVQLNTPYGYIRKAPTPLAKVMPGVYYHVTAHIGEFLKEVKRDNGTIEIKDRHLFTSPDAALDYARWANDGVLPPDTAIVAIRTVPTDVGMNKNFKPVSRVETFLDDAGKSQTVVVSEVVVEPGTKLLVTEPTLLSKSNKGVSGNLTGEMLVRDQRSFTNVNILWFNTEAAKAAGLTAPSPVQLQAIALEAFKATLNDLLHPRFSRIEFTTESAKLKHQLFEDYLAPNLEWKELSTDRATKASVRSSLKDLKALADSIARNEQILLDSASRIVLGPEIRKTQVEIVKDFASKVSRDLQKLDEIPNTFFEIVADKILKTADDIMRRSKDIPEIDFIGELKTQVKALVKHLDEALVEKASNIIDAVISDNSSNLYKDAKLVSTVKIEPSVLAEGVNKALQQELELRAKILVLDENFSEVASSVLNNMVPTYYVNITDIAGHIATQGMGAGLSEVPLSQFPETLTESIVSSIEPEILAIPESGSYKLYQTSPEGIISIPDTDFTTPIAETLSTYGGMDLNKDIVSNETLVEEVQPKEAELVVPSQPIPFKEFEPMIDTSFVEVKKSSMPRTATESIVVTEATPVMEVRSTTPTSSYYDKFYKTTPITTEKLLATTPTMPIISTTERIPTTTSKAFEHFYGTTSISTIKETTPTTVPTKTYTTPLTDTTETTTPISETIITTPTTTPISHTGTTPPYTTPDTVPITHTTYDTPPPSHEITTPPPDFTFKFGKTIRLKSKKRGDEEKSIESLREAITWRQGLIWLVILPPYTREDVYTTDAPPPANIFRADKGTPDETLSEVKTGKQPPKVTFEIPWGIFNIRYDNGKLTYVGNEKVHKFGSKKEQKAKAPGVKITDITEEYRREKTPRIPEKVYTGSDIDVIVMELADLEDEAIYAKIATYPEHIIGQILTRIEELTGDRIDRNAINRYKKRNVQPELTLLD